MARVGLDSATFTGLINPNEEATTYRFEYVANEEFETGGFDNARQIPIGGESIGDEASFVNVEQEAAGLIPHSKYHVRLVAESPGGTTIGKELIFTTFFQANAGLPDGRAYRRPPRRPRSERTPTTCEAEK